MNQLVVGILAHVDAGKTTLSEGLLYLCGTLRRMGRVDHGDAFLDTYEMEKERGITIFSKQAVLDTEGLRITLLDTPGHVDFSAEMERTLQVLDYAVLLVSGPDGVQGHTLTVWKLLQKYQIPVFLFINKMDQEGTDKDRLMEELRKRFGDGCVCFSCDRSDAGFQENIAFCDENALETFLDKGELSNSEITSLIRNRKVFPCYFGSALQMTGVEDFLEGLKEYTIQPEYPPDFGAKVFKISRDEKGNRLTYLKVTGGKLSVKDLVTNERKEGIFPVPSHASDEIWQEKADQIRIYSGAKFETAAEALPGAVCAVTGLTRTYPGEGLGWEEDSAIPVLEPVLTYQIILPPDRDVHVMLRNLRELEEEDPLLRILWDERLQEIHAMLMGEVQTEVLKRLIWERFHTAVEFGSGSVVYRETIRNTVEGVGHFEPLRHYAEVHLLLEPGERGSGLQFFTACSEDVLSRNWQRLILTHLEEKEHLGVLTGSPITDMQITLLTGKAHLKHTEGGDFRQATYRAVRQGLMKAETVLLEPYYSFTLEIPADVLGRAMTDIQKMQGSFSPPLQEGDLCTLKGTAPVSEMRDYQTQVAAYSRGLGKLFCVPGGYEPCRNQEEAAARSGYDPDSDLDNPSGSVFCAHGAGFVVPWYQVEDYMHLDMEGNDPGEEQEIKVPRADPRREESFVDEKELQEIFERTFGPVRRRLPSEQKRIFTAPKEHYRAPRPKKSTEEYLLVDGYNIIFAWEELRELAKANVHAAQDKLMDILSNYQGIRQCTLILVFDAYKVEGHREEILKNNNIYVVYTKEAETADQYIEKTVHRLGKDHPVTVATSDRLEQIIILGQGARKLSAEGLKEEIDAAMDGIRQSFHTQRISSRNYLLDKIPEDVGKYLQDLKIKGAEQKKE